MKDPPYFSKSPTIHFLSTDEGVLRDRIVRKPVAWARERRLSLSVHQSRCSASYVITDRMLHPEWSTDHPQWFSKLNKIKGSGDLRHWGRERTVDWESEPHSTSRELCDLEKVIPPPPPPPTPFPPLDLRLQLSLKIGWGELCGSCSSCLWESPGELFRNRFLGLTQTF